MTRASRPPLRVLQMIGGLMAIEYSALAWLLDHPETWQSFGTPARDHILATYSVQAQAGTHLSPFQ